MKKLLAILLALPLALVAAAQSPAVLNAQEGYVDAHGVLIYYTAFGTGQPFVLLHGGPGATHDYFLPWVLPLAHTHRLIFIDERGAGRSERLEDVHQYTVENNVEDVEAVRVALNLGKIDLLGHSAGGVLAQAYALKYQQNLRHLILNSTFGSTTAMNKVLAEEKEKMPAGKLKRLNDLEQAGLFGKGEPWEHGRYPAEYNQLAWGTGYFPFLYGARPDSTYDPAQGNAPSNWELYREMWGSHGEFVIDGNLKSVEYLDRLATLKVPTLVLVGDHDECAPSLSQAMHAKIAGSKLVVLPDSGHMNFVDQPNLWHKSVSDFLAN
ncbi:MAG: proline iminopeptidase-family hydrolase [Terracidiphilus sp.]|nr:proline iminopeptidase-family hydrolase [Terracidiphilus sp.]